MNELLAQIIIAARNNDREGVGWMQILVFVILAVFYALGGIAKAKANKLKKQQQEQTGRKPGFKPPEGTGAPKTFQRTPYQQVQRPTDRIPGRQPSQQVRPPRRKVARPQPAVQKLATKKEQDILPETLESPELSLLRPQLQPSIEELPEFIGKPVKGLREKHVGIPAEKPPAEYVHGLLLDYADPDKLRRAILHYEILGKPLALRGPSERVVGF